MYLAYTYFIENTISGQFYYGSRYKNIKLNRTPEEDLWIHYFTSSKIIKKDIEIYGKESFKYSIIFKSQNYDECYWIEQDLIKEYIKSPYCANRHYIDSSSKKNKFSAIGYIMPQSQKDAISIRNTGRKQSEETKKLKSLKTKGVSRKSFTEEHKKNMSLVRLGKPTGRKGISISTKGKTYEQIYGSKVAKELKLKRSLKWKNKQGFQKSGKDNPNAMRITIYGLHFGSKKEACIYFNISYYELGKLI